MPVGVLAPDDGWPGHARVVDLTLAVVVARDEERSLGVILLEEIQEVGGIGARTVVVGHGHSALGSTGIDASAAVRNTAKLGSRQSCGVRARGYLVGVTGRSVLKLAVRRRAVVLTGTAVASRTVSQCAPCEGLRDGYTLPESSTGLRDRQCRHC